MNEKTKRVLELDEAAESRSSNPLASDAMEMYEAAFIDPLEYGDVIRMLPKLAQRKRIYRWKQSSSVSGRGCTHWGLLITNLTRMG